MFVAKIIFVSTIMNSYQVKLTVFTIHMNIEIHTLYA